MLSERPPSPAPSMVSMRSDNSMGYRPNLREQDDSMKEREKRPPSPAPSMVSMRSDNSMGYRPNLREQDDSMKESEKRPPSPAPSMVSMRSDNSMGYRPNLREQDDSMKEREKRPPSPAPSMVSMRSDNSMGYRPNLREQDDSKKESEKRPPSPAPSMVSMRSDNSMGYRPNLREQDDSMKERHQPEPVKGQEQLKTISEHLMKSTSGGSTQHISPSSLTNIYTDLIITEGREIEVNYEHEIRQIEMLFRRAATQTTTINSCDIFKPLPGQQKDIKTVLTNGIAGIGKTVTVEKFVLDWTENKANQDIQLIILLPFKELNVFKTRLISLTELLEHFCKPRKDICSVLSDSNIMLILDGLDESRIPLSFTNEEMCHDATQITSVDVLLTNLIKRNLLPSALLWITTRPAAASQIPPEFIDRVTDIRGFNDLQKEEYFRKRTSDEILANRIITHLKSSRSLYIMCYIPVFCWIAATVLEIIFSDAEWREIPRTITQMYTHFLITQTNVKKEKYMIRKEKDEEMIIKLGKLAFHQLEKGNLIFYEDDLKECGIDMKEASVYSGVCTQIFREEYGMHKGKMFCFVHLSIQEFLAALYAHISCLRDSINVFEPCQTITPMRGLKDLHEEAVNRAIQSPNGHLDLFLRFLLGLSTRSNQRLLKTLLPRMRQSMKHSSHTVKYLKQKIKENPLPEKSINLFHCLNKLSYQPLIEEVKTFLHSKILHKIKLSTDHWAALVFILFTSENDLDVFDLSHYMGSNEALQMLLPVVKVAKRLLIRQCNLTEKSCEMLADVLRPKSWIKELDLSGSHLQLREVKLLCSALESEDSNLEQLRLNGCKLTEESCDAVVSAFSSNSASLRELDMSGNQLNDSVVKKLSETLKTVKCQLEVLRLRLCGVKQEGFRNLTSALQANPSHLKELDLSMNTSGDEEVHALCEVLSKPQCRLQVFKLNKCELTQDCCPSLASIMSSESSTLLELHLRDNKLHDAGVERLAAGLEKAHCKLQVLKLCNCSVSGKGCGFLASALRQNPSHLRELYLNWNHPKDSGTNPLTELLDSRPPDLRLEKLEINSVE
ncbi:NLR family CARD domain-containing protein 3-like isoform X2 [Sardina pilchardus]|uniref:NLR family CARD domain-containing protein 3-like isoform X2 n=1 Tax=Sardina pilchardus TaxID=27697 RepID=UPI002E0E04E7